ncbi:hypothetical protein A2866_04365 [Candidatus Roizmanbacteria bacterium RIFCSPHIGHO2_01_FULL_39_8]|uniref:Uncharacterized protein n=3 Tax=Candidatus Roizmaniibacteriota TaxID=1752723 RepID=A0A1F7GJU4_9BACT|nr:MAG: hypothetical protein A2866_04365 [Candidatus Roizmanbacteria bacterium RIFCSPHIGHO2_01_FULL_39_8]OGK26307.1 MAG: hypothetical protein A3C28_02200 [Candidatus Roizmanbacteria bacterium RIFCSPHIGHO2_02_FULL_39_9]OGK35011.1 MAG: hypothetical protein A3F60_02545 [Candidatus Roizmanbacteria bacterium RIFCSPHIGHO2_12_FULL_39_8]
MKKKGPAILIISLIIFLVFVVGTRYGQKVEKTNKVIDYLISLPPSPTVQPTQAPVEFEKYSNKSCGISFLYLSGFKPTQESSDSASIGDINRSVSFLCNPAEDKNYNIIRYLNDPQTATAEVTLENKKMVVKSIAAGAGNIYLFSLKNPLNGKVVFFGVSDSLYPLFEKSLEFMK